MYIKKYASSVNFFNSSDNTVNYKKADLDQNIEITEINNFVEHFFGKKNKEYCSENSSLKKIDNIPLGNFNYTNSNQNRTSKLSKLISNFASNKAKNYGSYNIKLSNNYKFNAQHTQPIQGIVYNKATGINNNSFLNYNSFKNTKQNAFTQSKFSGISYESVNNADNYSHSKNSSYARKKTNNRGFSKLEPQYRRSETCSNSYYGNNRGFSKLEPEYRRGETCSNSYYGNNRGFSKLEPQYRRSETCSSSDYGNNSKINNLKMAYRFSSSYY